MDRNLALDFIRVTEAAAMASARWVGKGEKEKADDAAVEMMRKTFAKMDIDGTVVIGEGERDEAPMLYIGEKIGSGKGFGVDIAVDMLDIGKLKIRKKGLGNLITLQEGDAENLNFDDGSFDAATVAFGVRNFETLQKGLMEMHRVINTGGIIIVLEFSKHKAFPFKQLYNFYFRFILPLFGQFVSKSNSAYTYLPNSVKGFAEDEVFMNELKKAGFKRPKQQRLTMGIATIYYAHK